MMKHIKVHSIKSQTSEIFTNYSTVWDIVEISETLRHIFLRRQIWDKSPNLNLVLEKLLILKQLFVSFLGA